MNTPTQEAVLEYDRECRRLHPNITQGQLRDVLRARFLCGKDPLGSAAGGIGGLFVPGLICNPLDWLVGLARIIAGVFEIQRGDHRGTEDVIEGVLRIVF